MTVLLQTIQQEVKMLPNSLLTEVLDFIHFLRSDQSEEDFLWQQVGETYNRRQRDPKSVVTVSASEFLADTADLDD